MLFKLSRRINSAGELRTLATIGLGIEEHVIDGHLYNEKDINEAALSVLKEWRKGQPNSKVAYSELCEVLTKENVRMDFYIADVLQ